MQRQGAGAHQAGGGLVHSGADAVNGFAAANSKVYWLGPDCLRTHLGAGLGSKASVPQMSHQRRPVPGPGTRTTHVQSYTISVLQSGDKGPHRSAGKHPLSGHGCHVPCLHCMNCNDTHRNVYKPQGQASAGRPSLKLHLKDRLMHHITLPGFCSANGVIVVGFYGALLSITRTHT